jgi:4-coumarate--CoA ligase
VSRSKTSSFEEVRRKGVASPTAVMPLTSPLKDIAIPQTDILTYLFPPGSSPSEDPIWLDAADPENCLSPKQLLQWVKRLSIGLDRLGIQQQEAVMILTPNHIFVPAAYLGIVGSRRIFSAGNPIYTVPGKSHPILSFHPYETNLCHQS